MEIAHASLRPQTDKLGSKCSLLPVDLGSWLHDAQWIVDKDGSRYWMM